MPVAKNIIRTQNNKLIGEKLYITIYLVYRAHIYIGRLLHISIGILKRVNYTMACWSRNVRMASFEAPIPLADKHMAMTKKNSKKYKSVCAPFFRKSKKHSRHSDKLVVRKCKQDGEGLSAQSTTATTIREPEGLAVEPSFVTCSSFEDGFETAQTSPSVFLNKTRGDAERNRNTVTTLCKCGFNSHLNTYDPSFPLITAPGVEAGTHAEKQILCQSMVGHWVTQMERSQSMDAQFKTMGITYVKRCVMNRLAVPLTIRMEENNTMMHVYIHTPLGLRHMNSDLTGKPFSDDDPDCGVWEGKMGVVDFSIPWFCGGKTVRALQQIRTNKKINATQIETRVLLPHKDDGKIMLFNFVMYPNNDESKKQTADRILLYINDGTKLKLT